MSDDGILTLLRLALAIGVLSYASVLDWRTRRVANKFWILLSLAGLALIAVQLAMDEEQLAYVLVAVPIVAILLDVYVDTENQKWGPYITASKYAAAVLSILLLAYAFGVHTYFQHLLAVPIFMLLIVVLYFLDVVRGGADAKALVSLAILFPFYPKLSSLPAIQPPTSGADILFPFAFVVLFTAAIIVAIVPLAFLAVNLWRREFRFPQAFFGYMLDQSQVKGKHYWLMERMEDGKRVVFTKPKHEEDLVAELDRLAEAGHSRVWVTPQVPFIIPMLIGLFVATILGNVFYLVISP